MNSSIADRRMAAVRAQLDEAAFFLRVYAYQMVGQTYSEDLVQAAGQMSERSWERYRRRTANQTV